MKTLIVAIAALAFLIVPVSDVQATGGKSVTFEADGYTIKGKKCLIKKRCDFKLFVKKSAQAPGVVTTERPKSLRYGYGGRGGYGRGGGWGRGPHVVHHYGPGYDPGAAVVGGIIGGALVNWWTRPEPPPPPPPPPEPEPAPVDTGTVVLEPFTPDWFEYCGNKYQSFDPKTGFYVSLEGGKKFCR